MSANFVFVRRGVPGPPLSPLYDGPYKVTARGLESLRAGVGGPPLLLFPCSSAKPQKDVEFFPVKDPVETDTISL